MIRSLRSFGFLRPPNAILVPVMYFFGFSRYSNYFMSICGYFGGSVPSRELLTSVSLFHSIALFLLASEYAKPSTLPVCLPKRPWRFGPILLPSPSLRLWHCWHRVCFDQRYPCECVSCSVDRTLNRFAPFLASPRSCQSSVVAVAVWRQDEHIPSLNDSLPILIQVCLDSSMRMIRSLSLSTDTCDR